MAIDYDDPASAVAEAERVLALDKQYNHTRFVIYGPERLTRLEWQRRKRELGFSWHPTPGCRRCDGRGFSQLPSQPCWLCGPR